MINLSYKPKYFFYIPTGFDIDTHKSNYLEINDKERASKLDSNDDIVVGMLGRYTIEKKHDYLIDVVGRLRREGINIQLLLAGGFGVDYKNSEIVTQIRLHGIEHCTKLLGVVENKTNFFNQLDVFCMLSDSEGFRSPVVPTWPSMYTRAPMRAV